MYPLSWGFLASFFFCLAVDLAAAQNHSQFVLFPSTIPDGSSRDRPIDGVDTGFGNSSIIPAACASALNSTIKCDERVRYLASENYYDSLNGTETELCTTQCKNSLASYHQAVVSACQGTQVYRGAPNSWLGDTIWAWVNTTCQTHSGTGQLCAEWILQEINTQGSGLTDPLDLPNSVLCSDCMVNYWTSKQSTSYLNYDDDDAKDWAAIQKKCGLSLPTAVLPPALSNPLSDLITFNGTVNAAPCLSGNTYTVTGSDTCTSIALAKSVGSGALRILNNLLPDCSNLVPGTSLCLPRPCQTYVFKANDTCESVALTQGGGVSDALIIAWNPAINAMCSNIDLAGSVICVSSPWDEYTPSTVPGQIATQTSPYAAASVSPPSGLTGSGTTLSCGKWIVAKDGDNCFAIGLQYGIELDLFMAINPSIDAECDNMQVGLAYCVQPTADWNTTDSRTTPTISGSPPITQTSSVSFVPPPGPTPTGTTSQCLRWYLVQPGDSCFLITSAFSITQARFVAWNPSVGSDCGLILTGEYYCVKGPSSSTTTTTSVTSTSTGTKTTTITTSKKNSSTSNTSRTSSSSHATTTAAGGGGGGCTKTYTIVSGDFCFKIWTDNALTEAQFRALNPSLDANCDLDIGQVVCVG